MTKKIQQKRNFNFLYKGNITIFPLKEDGHLSSNRNVEIQAFALKLLHGNKFTTNWMAADEKENTNI